MLHLLWFKHFTDVEQSTSIYQNKISQCYFLIFSTFYLSTYIICLHILVISSIINCSRPLLVVVTYLPWFKIVKHSLCCGPLDWLICNIPRIWSKSCILQKSACSLLPQNNLLDAFFYFAKSIFANRSTLTRAQSNTYRCIFWSREKICLAKIRNVFYTKLGGGAN